MSIDWEFTCASYNPLTKDAHGNEFILVIIDAFSRWVELFHTETTTAIGQLWSYWIILVGSDHPKSSILIKDRPFIMNLLLNSYDLAISSNHLLLHTQARRTVSWNVPIKKYYDTYVLYSSIAVSAISGNLSSFHLFSVSWTHWKRHLLESLQLS